MRFKKLTSILLVAILFTLLNNWTTVASTTPQAGAKRYIIKFKTSSTNESQVVSKYSGNLKHKFKNLNASVAVMTTKNLASLKKDSKIAYVEEDSLVQISAITYTNWGISSIKAPALWSLGLTGTGVKIAIIDTGAGPHADLTIAGGVNVISGSATKSYVDDNGHGTHVSGIIAAKGSNGGVIGVAPGSSIYAVKALNAAGSGYLSDVISGIDWAIENKMNIISMSLGSTQSTISLQNAVDTAYSKGILIVAAAGNSGNSAGTGTSVNYPANYSSVIAVGAVDSTNTRAYFSSTGSKVEVSAPGVSVMSTYLNGGYIQLSGTSMATPFVAGDLALLKQKYPNYTNVQLRQLLDSNILDLGVKGRDPLYGFGLIQAVIAATVPVTTPVVVKPPVVEIPTPTANIPSGSYKAPLRIQLYDQYSKPLKAFYTLNGSTPTVKSLPYSGNINITATSTLKAIAVDYQGNISGVLSNLYTIIKPPATPVVTSKTK